MAMEEALVARLAGAAAIAALLPTAGDGSKPVSWLGRQRGDPLPAILLAHVSPGREWDHAGPDELDLARVQIDCVATNSAKLAALARAVQAEMEQARTQSGVLFHPAQLEMQGWSDEGEIDGGETHFRAMLDFTFYHEET